MSYIGCALPKRSIYSNRKVTPELPALSDAKEFYENNR